MPETFRVRYVFSVITTEDEDGDESDTLSYHNARSRLSTETDRSEADFMSAVSHFSSEGTLCDSDEESDLDPFLGTAASFLARDSHHQSFPLRIQTENVFLGVEVVETLS